MTNNNFSNDLKQILSEAYNQVMANASNAISSLISAKTQICDCEITECTLSELTNSEYDPAVIVKVNYTSGTTGPVVMLFKRNDIQLILNQLMGMPLMVSPDFKFNEINISALGEIMNYMMKASSAEFSKLTSSPVSNSTPEIITDVETSIEKVLSLDSFDSVCVVTSKLIIDNFINSKFISVMPLDTACRLAEKSQDKIQLRKPVQISADQPLSPFAVSPEQQPMSFTSFQNTLTQEQLNNLQLLMNVPLELSIEIGSTQKKVDDILSFSHGTVIELDCQADAPVNVIVNGHLIARGDVVVVDDYFAVRITEILKSNLLDTLNVSV